MALEDKVNKAEIITKDILKNFAYFSAAYGKLSNTPRGDDSANVYGAVAFKKVYENLDPVTKEYMKSVYEVASEDSDFAVEVLGKYTQLYQTKIGKAKCSDLIEVVKDFGYNENLPEFLNKYANESMKSISEKYKAQLDKKDPKITSVMQALGVLSSIIPRKAESELDDAITKLHLDQLGEVYKKANKKEQEELAKAA